MAGTPVAALQNGFVSSDTTAISAQDDHLVGGIRAVRWLQAAAVIHAGALVLALLELFFLPLPFVLLTGLAVTLLALRVPLLSVPPAQRLAKASSVSEPADLSPAQKGSKGPPTLLPFIGERINLNPNTAQLEGLARAAARLSRLPSSRSHPWGDLIARVSHELRTPLNAVIGFSDVMRSELLGPVGHPRYREYAQHICDSGRELLKSAEDTLAITYLLDHDPSARVETGVDLAPIVTDAWEFHVGPPGGATGLTLEVDLPESLEVLMDRRPMRQILINLFAEAVRRSDARGTVGFGATVDGDLVQIEVYLRGRPDSSMAGQASLPMCLARALLELHGASLIEVEDPYSTWRAVTVLPCAAQSDFFRMPDSFAQAEAQPILC
ncbi:sensor histidine kinase [Hyphomicrobium sp.]|uniref:sensor histidine kinase n=1 Tax=Hyphomicrobium sp. TaxID=82 RepID=UPI003F70797A